MVDKLPPMNLPGPAVPYMRAIEKKLMEVANQVLRTDQNLSNIRANAKQGGTAFDLAMTRLNNLDRTVTEIPLAPSGIVASQHWAWDALKHASSTMNVSWDAVTKSGTGADVSVVTYEVWLREANQSRTQRALAVSDLAAVVTGLKPATGYYVSVSGVTASGTVGGLSNEVYVAPPAALVPLTPPTAPALVSDFGVVVVAWDGLLTGPNPIPDHFDYVAVLMSDAATGPWAPVGPILRTAGSVSIADAPVDSTRYFKLVAYDRLGGNSPDSTVVSILVKGVDLGTLGADLDQLQTDLDALATNPIDGSRVTDGSILSPKIGAGQVTALNIGAGQIRANHLAADAVEANSIKAGAIQANHLSPSVGQQIDISANNSVNILVGSINDAAADIDNVNGTVEQMTTYYQFGPTGATITTPSSPFAVGIRNDRIDMLQQGVAVSSWNAGQMFVSSFVGDEVVLGNHKLEKYGTGTVVRAI